MEYNFLVIFLYHTVYFEINHSAKGRWSRIKFIQKLWTNGYDVALTRRRS